jgi:hypothetical protein
MFHNIWLDSIKVIIKICFAKYLFTWSDLIIICQLFTRKVVMSLY